MLMSSKKYVYGQIVFMLVRVHRESEDADRDNEKRKCVDEEHVSTKWYVLVTSNIRDRSRERL